MAVHVFGGVPIKEYADYTLFNMTKKELVDYIRELEHNIKSMGVRFDLQMKLLDQSVVVSHWVNMGGGPLAPNNYRCANCGFEFTDYCEAISYYKGCPGCRAEMEYIKDYDGDE